MRPASSTAGACEDDSGHAAREAVSTPVTRGGLPQPAPPEETPLRCQALLGAPPAPQSAAWVSQGTARRVLLT